MMPPRDTLPSSLPDDAPGAAIQVVLRPKNLLPRLQPEYRLDRFPATIGRHPTNDIELPFDSVSRFHARIEIQEHMPRIVDLRSSNGTFVNNRRVQIAPLVENDVLAFGGVELSVAVERSASGRIDTSDVESGTSVHLTTDELDVVKSIIQADVAGDTSSIAVLQDDITDSDALRLARDRLITLYRLQEILRSTTDEKKLLRGVVNLLFQVLPVDRGVVLVRDEHDASLFNPLAVRVRSGDRSPRKIGISKTILNRCLKEKVAILTHDAQVDERFKESESIMINRIRSAMCAPLISQHRIFGFVYLDTAESYRSFGRDDLAFLATVSHEVAIHLHNLRMLQEKIVAERMAAIGQTITGLAHNIKNVLLLSQGGMELMAKRLEEKSYDSLPETWNIVKRGIDRINKLTKDMLDFARAREVKKTRCNVNKLLKEIRDTCSDELQNRNVKCELDLDDACPSILIDAGGLDKAVVNLLVNAIEACPEGEGVIVLRTRCRAGGVFIIEIEDNAGGIPAEVLPRIFFPFFTTKGTQGSGLGLAQTKKYVEDMGGRIEVKTEEGVGTTFTIALPVEPSDIRLETPSPGAGPENGGT